MDTPQQLPIGCRLINGYKYYCVNEIGTVFSCRTRGGKFRPWTPMSPQWSHPGKSQARLFVCLRDVEGLIPKTIHRLVLETFTGPCPEGKEACHNDGDSSNCQHSNLRWDTHLNNMADRKKHGNNPDGEKNPAAVLTKEEVLEIRRLKTTGLFNYQIAPLFGVCKNTIQAITSRTIWAHI